MGREGEEEDHLYTIGIKLPFTWKIKEKKKKRNRTVWKQLGKNKHNNKKTANLDFSWLNHVKSAARQQTTQREHNRCHVLTMMNMLTTNIYHSKKAYLSQGEHKTDWKAMLRFAISDPMPKQRSKSFGSFCIHCYPIFSLLYITPIKPFMFHSNTNISIYSISPILNQM